MWIVSLFLFAHFLMEHFVFFLLTCMSSWFIMDFNPLIYIHCNSFLQPVTYLLFLKLVFLMMENHREFILDFYSRKSWVSSQEPVCSPFPLPSPPLPHPTPPPANLCNCVSFLALAARKLRTNLSFLTSSNSPEPLSRHLVTWSHPRIHILFPSHNFIVFLFLFSVFIMSVSYLKSFLQQRGAYRNDYFLFIAAHFKNDETKAHRGAMT